MSLMARWNQAWDDKMISLKEKDGHFAPENDRSREILNRLCQVESFPEKDYDMIALQVSNHGYGLEVIDEN